jgi:hypothetical protein
MSENETTTETTETAPEGLVGRKVYLTPQMDQWLEETFAEHRQRSAATMAALELFKAAVEARKDKIRTRRVFTLEDVLEAL